MIKILFVCHGNICRSPMAEFVMRDIAAKAHFPIEIASAATSREELGSPVYPPAARKLRQHGIDPTGKRARQLTPADYGKYDLLVGMDHANIRNMNRMCGGDPEGKIRLLLDFTGEGGQVADPWYTDDFDTAYSDILRGCSALLEHLREGKI